MSTYTKSYLSQELSSKLSPTDMNSSTVPNFSSHVWYFTPYVAVRSKTLSITSFYVAAVITNIKFTNYNNFTNLIYLLQFRTRHRLEIRKHSETLDYLNRRQLG